VFCKAQFKDNKGNTKYWREKGMTKQGVVLTRGKQTKTNTLNTKTKDYVLDVLGRSSSMNMPNAKRLATRQRRKTSPRKRNPQRRQRRKAHIPLRKQDGRVTPAASCLRPDRARARRHYASEASESDKSDGSASVTSAASVEITQLENPLAENNHACFGRRN
jgi:hypothetical protein